MAPSPPRRRRDAVARRWRQLDAIDEHRSRVDGVTTCVTLTPSTSTEKQLLGNKLYTTTDKSGVELRARPRVVEQQLGRREVVAVLVGQARQLVRVELRADGVDHAEGPARER